MQIQELFAKKIDREIQGVIIVGQGEETNVSQELKVFICLWSVSLNIIVWESLGQAANRLLSGSWSGWIK